MLLQAIVGGLCFLAGVVGISRPTKDLHPAIKYTPLFLCVAGTINMWDYSSQKIPVIADAKINILQVEGQRMYVEVEPHFARRCNLRDMDVYLVDVNKVETRVPANFVNPQNYSLQITTPGWQKDSVLEIQADPRQYESFYFVAHDKCAFDVNVKSEFGHTLIPQKFNAGIHANDTPKA